MKSQKSKIHSTHLASKQEHANSSILDSASVSPSADPGLCRFACSDCSLTFITWKRLTDHVKKAHNKLVRKCELEGVLFKASVHICKICSMKVLNDHYFLAIHFKSVHKMFVTQYRQQYNCHSVQSIHKMQLLKTMETSRQSEKVIGNLCTFRCPGCNKVCYSQAAFYDHFLFILFYRQCPKASGHLLLWALRPNTST